MVKLFYIFFLSPVLSFCSCSTNDNLKKAKDSAITNDLSKQTDSLSKNINKGFNVKRLNERKDSFEKPAIIPLTASEEAAIEIGYQKYLDELNKKWQSKPAPQFTAIDYSGKKMSIHDIYATKYVLLDFWASWCVPCREAVPFLKTIAKKYELTLQMVSITCDDSKEKWKEAIVNEKILGWINLRLKESNKTVSGYAPEAPDPISESYGIGSIPTWVLISKGGSIVGIYGNTTESKNKLKADVDSFLSKF